MNSKKALYDLFPAVIFFVCYLIGGIYAGTLGLMIATSLQVAAHRYFEGLFDKTQLITMALVFLFGGATLFFHNPLFIQWKFTILYWLFALILLGSHVIGKKCIIQRLLEDKIPVPEAILKRANYAWGLFFIWFGCLNLFIVYTYSQKVWMMFKMFGATGILLMASFIFALYLSRYMNQE